MAKLETQINQIYLISPQSKKSALILHEERLRDPLHLFVLLELVDIKKKTELNDLNKISEIITSQFQQNEKSGAGTIFESTLASINQQLGDLAHKGSKSWVGKFSALIALKTDTEIFIANGGNTSAWLKRKSSLSEIVSSDKLGDHPLKMFSNFVSGKIKFDDEIILTTTNLFNFVSMDLLTGMLSSQELSAVASEISTILKDSADKNDSFGTFLLKFVEPDELTAVAPPLASEPAAEITPLPVTKKEVPENIYAPLPEDLPEVAEQPTAPRTKFNFSKYFSWVGTINFTWLKRLRMPRLDYFKRASLAGKFFLISFLILALVLLINLVVWGTRYISDKNQEVVAQKMEQISLTLSEAESALIYQNEDQAVVLLDSVKEDLDSLEGTNEQKAQLDIRYNLLVDRVYRINTIFTPQHITDLRNNPSHMARAGTGYIFTGNQASTYSTFIDNNYETPLLLNEPAGAITGLLHLPGIGNWITAGNQVYRINETSDLFESLATIADGNLQGLKFLSPNRAYTANLATGQILRLPLSSGRITGSQNVLDQAVDMTSLRDFGVDTDVYLLYPNEIRRFVAGTEQAFRLPKLAEPMTDATRLFAGSNLYVLEPAKKRLLIFGKNSSLINQIVFPNAEGLADFYVNETERRINLIDGNRLVEITF